MADKNEFCINDSMQGVKAFLDKGLKRVNSSRHRLTHTFFAERDRWPLWVPFFIGLGIIVYFSLGSEPQVLAGPVLALGLAALAVRAYRYAGIGVQLVFYILLLAAVGFTAAQLRTQNIAAPVLAKETYPVYFMGRIDEIQPQPSSTRLVLDNLRVEETDASRLPQKVRVQVYNLDPTIKVGDYVRLKGVLRPPPPPVSPGAYDFGRHLYYQQIGAVGYAYEGPDKVTDSPSVPFEHRIERLRHSVRHIIETHSGADSTGAVITALMTGIRTSIDREVLQDLRDAGLSHLLSISGLHIGLIAGIVFTVVRLLFCLVPEVALRWPVKKIAAVFAIIGALLYLLMAGAPVPTQRAFIMTGIVFLAVLVDRKGISLRLVAVAATVILLWMPEVILSPSFQMSFAAVIALVAAYEYFQPRLQTINEKYPAYGKVLVYTFAILLTTLVAEAATVSFGIHHFNRMTLYNMVANLVAMPVVVFWVMPWMVLSYLAMPLGLAAGPLYLMGQGVDIVLWISATVTSWPKAVFIVPVLSSTGVLLIAFGGLWLCIWRRRWRIAGLIPVAAGLMTIPFYHHPDILVSSSGRLVAIREQGNVYLTTTRAEKFVSENWLHRFGYKQGRLLVDAAATVNRLGCDPLACLYQRGDQIFSIAFDYGALEQDCPRVDVLVSELDIGTGCAARHVIDAERLKNTDAQALWVDDGKVTIKTVAQWRGSRPWALTSLRREWLGSGVVVADFDF